MKNDSEEEERDDSYDNEIASQDEKKVEEEEKKEELKRKKKKRHRKARNQNSQQNADRTKVDLDEDEIERTVQEINKLLGEPVPSTSRESTDDSKSFVLKSKEEVLTVQHKHLNPLNELKRIFGSKTVQAEEKLVLLKMILASLIHSCYFQPIYFEIMT